MIVKTPNVNILGNISPEIITQYLKARGWQESDSFYGNASVWHRGDELEILLPQSDQLRDYKTRVNEILDILEISEERDRQQILNDLILKPTDLIKIRIDSTDIIGGTIPIEEAVQLFDAISRIMKFTASATIQPRSVYRGGVFTMVREYLQELRVGETEQGSYIVNILSPIMQDHGNFGRNVNISLNTALAAINTTTQDVMAGSNIEVFEQAIDAGVSSNLCDALLEVSAYNDLQDLSFRWQWSPMWDVPSLIKEHLALTKPTFPILKEASKLLKSKNIIRKHSDSKYHSQHNDRLTLISGKVIGFERRDETSAANVTVLAKIDGRERELLLELSEPFYRKAVHSHLDRHKITCYGEIFLDGNVITARNIKDFCVV